MNKDKLDAAFYDMIGWWAPTIMFSFGVILCMVFPCGILPKLVFGLLAGFSCLCLCEKISKYTKLLK